MTHKIISNPLSDLLGLCSVHSERLVQIFPWYMGYLSLKKVKKLKKIEKLKKKTKSKIFQKVFCPKTLTSVFF